MPRCHHKPPQEKQNPRHFPFPFPLTPAAFRRILSSSYNSSLPKVSQLVFPVHRIFPPSAPKDLLLQVVVNLPPAPFDPLDELPPLLQLGPHELHRPLQHDALRPPHALQPGHQLAQPIEAFSYRLAAFLLLSLPVSIVISLSRWKSEEKGSYRKRCDSASSPPPSVAASRWRQQGR